VAHTLRLGRKAFVQRACVVADSSRQAVASLRDPSSPQKLFGTVEAKAPDIVFMFPGQGAQYALMGKALYETEAVFREAFDACLQALDGTVRFDLKERLFSGDATVLTATETTQPALFCIEYALARFWLSL
jgi:acyl transferase domain-containing protein